MEESEFKRAYQDLNPRPCVFAKAVLNCRYACEKNRRLHIAEREEIACTSERAQRLCGAWQDELHRNATFALKLHHQQGALPHAKLLKLQCGGLLGLHAALHGPGSVETPGITNIYRLVELAYATYGEPGAFPYQEIVRHISHYPVRQKRR